MTVSGRPLEEPGSHRCTWGLTGAQKLPAPLQSQAGLWGAAKAFSPHLVSSLSHPSLAGPQPASVPRIFPSAPHQTLSAPSARPS